MARLRDEAKALRAKEWQPPFGAVADRVCEYFDEAADALEAAERQLRETETLLQDRIRTLTSQNPDFYEGELGRLGRDVERDVKPCSCICHATGNAGNHAHLCCAGRTSAK